jgi:hypothetical protein
MAVTISLYNQFRKKLANSEVNLADLKVMLLNASGVFSAAHTNITSLSANQVSGNGWTAGGEPLANAAITIANTSEGKFDADDVVKEAAGGSIGPAHAAVIYEAASGDVLVHIDFGGAKEAGVGTQFKIVWNAAGICRIA